MMYSLMEKIKMLNLDGQKRKGESYEKIKIYFEI